MKIKQAKSRSRTFQLMIGYLVIAFITSVLILVVGSAGVHESNKGSLHTKDLNLVLLLFSLAICGLSAILMFISPRYTKNFSKVTLAYGCMVLSFIGILYGVLGCVVAWSTNADKTTNDVYRAMSVIVTMVGCILTIFMSLLAVAYSKDPILTKQTLQPVAEFWKSMQV